jgi:hypothetical protein
MERPRIVVPVIAGGIPRIGLTEEGKNTEDGVIPTSEYSLQSGAVPVPLTWDKRQGRQTAGFML